VIEPSDTVDRDCEKTPLRAYHFENEEEWRTMDHYEDEEVSIDEAIAREGTKVAIAAGKIAATVVALGPVIIDELGKLADKLKELAGVDRITYEEAMKYFINHKKDSPAAAKGALLKEDVEGGFVITQVFLDKNNNLVLDTFGVPLGYKKRVKHMDDELIQVFKNKNLVIVE